MESIVKESWLQGGEGEQAKRTSVGEVAECMSW